MEIIRKIIVGILTVLAGIAIILVIVTLSNKGGDLVQQTRDGEISAQMSNYRVSHEPHGPAGMEFHAGEHVFFSLDVTRPEGCFVDVDYRIARIDGLHQHTVWTIEGARAYAPQISGVDQISQAFVLPTDLTPGHYSFTRLSGWQCGEAKVPAMNVMTLNLDIVAKDQPIA